MDHAEVLREEAGGSHAQFHQFILALQKGQADDQYLFFEGDDDPLFYVDLAQNFLNDRLHLEFICHGREGVLKVHELVARDRRAIERAHFFIDKDHNDILNGEEKFSGSIFRTVGYSFENYIVCERVLRRFWVERLHLPSTDSRLDQTIGAFRSMHKSFMRRMRILMALVLIGRGIDGRTALKLNLNNVSLDRVLRLDFSSLDVRWLPNAMQSFLAASNMIQAGVGPIRSIDIRRTCRAHLSSEDAKLYVRGKYELWFLVKFLMAKTRELADKKTAATLGVSRAKPNETISPANCLIQLAPLCPCPKDLARFFLERLGLPGVSR